MENWDQSFQRAYIAAYDLPGEDRTATELSRIRNADGHTEADLRIIRALRAGAETTAEIHEISAMSDSTIRHVLRRLERGGKARSTIIQGADGRQKLWELL